VKTNNPLSLLTAKRKVLELLRWILVLPAAWLGDYAGYVLGGLLCGLAVAIGLVNPPSDDSELNRSLRYLIWMFPEGVVGVIAGAKTAPRWHRTTAYVVALLWVFCINRIHGFEGPTVMATFVAALCGVACVHFLERDTSRMT
jgi:hypothetical protein